MRYLKLHLQKNFNLFFFIKISINLKKLLIQLKVFKQKKQLTNLWKFFQLL